MRRNLAMTRLARHFGHEVSYDGDEAKASLHLLSREKSVYTEAHRGGRNDRLEVFKNLPQGPPKGPSCWCTVPVATAGNGATSSPILANQVMPRTPCP